MFKVSRVILPLLVVLTVSVALGTSYAKRTLDQKIKEADLIVFGSATAIGDEVVASGD